MPQLTRYWFRFANLKKHSQLGLGCGITAYNQDDALWILREFVFPRAAESPEILEIIPNIDVRDLDQGHVARNIKPPNWRGVWFPRWD